MAIKLLDEKLINKIAAGEVVERPASVVKELVENSLDAGSHHIEVHISGGGAESLEVSDDGQGICEAEISLAFLRHATSKISGEDDLFNISTLGFRGEALPSIAAISRLEIYTRSASETGLYARLEGGRMQEQYPQSGPLGSKFIVRDLFYNTPARKKFLRSPVAEGNQVYELLCRYAMARPDVVFTYSNDRRTFFKTPGNGLLRDAVAAIWGVDLLQHLLDVDGMRGTYSLRGLVSSSEIHRQSRKNQIFFVNRRPVRSPLLFRALDTAYKGLLLSREQPLVILNLSLPEDEVDVNVHPQKSEVRFRDDKKVFTTLVEVISEVLDGMKVSPNWERLEESNRISGGMEELRSSSPHIYKNGIPSLWGHKEFNETKAVPTILEPIDYNRLNDSNASFRILGQCLETYIVIEKEQALWLVDQHAAHERIMYWRLKNRAQGVLGQVLAIPIAIELSTRHMEIMEAKQDKLEKMGFRLDPLGPNSMLIREAPGLLLGKEIEVLYELAELAGDGSVDYEDAALTMMACKKAVKSGTALPLAVLEQIVQELWSVPDYRFCPHGRPTVIKLSRGELDRMFKR